MNNHLFTHWVAHKKVECTCGWKRQVLSHPQAAQKHSIHVRRMGKIETPMRLKMMKTPFITIFEGGTV